MKSLLPWKLDEGDPSIIYDANGNIIAEDYKFLHVDDFEAICKFSQKAVEMVDEPKPKVQDIGVANGWKETPGVVKICWFKRHRQAVTRISKGKKEICCDICGYKYEVNLARF